METVPSASPEKSLRTLEQENNELRTKVAELAIAEERNRIAIANLEKQVQEIGLKADDAHVKCIVLRQASVRDAGQRLIKIYELMEMTMEYLGDDPVDLRRKRQVCQDFRNVIDTSTTLNTALF